MKQGLSLVAVGHATSLFLAITFVLCVAFDLLFPAHAMFQAWQKLLPGFHWLSLGSFFLGLIESKKLLPGFHWLSLGSFFLGLIESYAYGWYIALIWAPLYNVFALRKQR